MRTLRDHWPEYLIEAGCLATFMASAAFFGTLLNHPVSPVTSWVAPGVLRRLPMGVAMGLTAVAIIYSRPGQRSGAHMNPAVTLAFLRLGRIRPADAVGYIAGQFAGGFVGIALAVALLGGLPADPSVNYVATVPGAAGPWVAAAAEALMAFVLMTAVLRCMSQSHTARFTGLVAGTLVALYITVEDPLSGMSMNPARTLGPALLAGATEHLWVYFTAPILGTVTAAELFGRRASAPRGCARLHHSGGRCVFNCADVPPSLSPKEAAA